MSILLEINEDPDGRTANGKRNGHKGQRIVREGRTAKQKCGKHIMWVASTYSNLPFNTVAVTT